MRKAVASRAVRRLSGDPAGLAQILLLFRVVLVDGIIGARELEVFEGICLREFGIRSADLSQLHDVLESAKGQAAEKQLYVLLKQLDVSARYRLVGLMREIANACDDNQEQAVRLVFMTARLLGMEAEEA
ncbi:TerB family tellurite resistance protein [Pseudohoeflea suaedae]|uniref:TerB family tellurite resistance protein n=1 Tax=Pseudohoeflea suaedae TaxID=877384 RepID=UPI0013048448|nr:TerB family tellurite resistance protein [Pseudohoeflea suaedae]